MDLKIGKNHITISEYVDRVLSSSDPQEEFFKIPIEKQGFVFLSLSQDLQEELTQTLKVSHIQEIFKYLDPDEVTDFLQHISEDKHKKVSKKLDENLKEKVEYLLKFEPDSAAGLMNLDYIIITENSKVDTLYKKLKTSIRRKKKTPTVLVKDSQNHLVGYIPFKYFILNRPENLKKHVEEIAHVYYDEHYDDVIKKVKDLDLHQIVVIDYEEHVLGMIDIADLFKVVESGLTNKLYGFAGVKHEEDIFDSAGSKFKSRYMWLLINLGTAFLAATVVSMFEDTLSKLVLLAVYMPIIAGMGGNAATQTLAVVTRGLSLHEIDFKKKAQILFNELTAGLANGILNGIVVAIIAYYWNDMPMLGVVVGLSMIINLFIAGFFGTILPFILQKFKIDPAVAATVFVTTATDVFGFFIFLGLAELILL